MQKRLAWGTRQTGNLLPLGFAQLINPKAKSRNYFQLGNQTFRFVDFAHAGAGSPIGPAPSVDEVETRSLEFVERERLRAALNKHKGRKL